MSNGPHRVFTESKGPVLVPEEVRDAIIAVGLENSKKSFLGTTVVMGTQDAEPKAYLESFFYSSRCPVLYKWSPKQRIPQEGLAAFYQQVFNEVATQKQKGDIDSNQALLHHQVTEFIKDMPPETNFSALGKIDEIKQWFKYAAAADSPRDGIRNAFIRFVATHEDRDSFDWYKRWYAFRLPQIAAEILETTEGIDDLESLGRALDKEVDKLNQNQQAGFSVNEKVTAWSSVLRLMAVIGAENEKQIKDLFKERKQAVSKPQKSSLAIDPDQIRPVDQIFSDIKEVFAEATQSAGQKKRKAGGRARPHPVPRSRRPGGNSGR